MTMNGQMAQLTVYKAELPKLHAQFLDALARVSGGGAKELAQAEALRSQVADWTQQIARLKRQIEGSRK